PGGAGAEIRPRRCVHTPLGAGITARTGQVHPRAVDDAAQRPGARRLSHGRGVPCPHRRPRRGARARTGGIQGREELTNGEARPPTLLPLRRAPLPVLRSLTMRDELDLYIRARYPLLWVVTAEEQRALREIDELGK